MSLSVLDEFAAFIIKTYTHTLPALSWKWASMEHQEFVALHRVWLMRDVPVIVYIWRNDHLCRQKRSWTHGWGLVNGIDSYWICKTKTCWRSVDADFQVGAGIVRHAVFPIQVANTLFITVWNHSPLRLPRMQDQKSLTLRWCSLSGWTKECVAIICACEGSQYFDYVSPQPTQFSITRLP